MAGETMSDAVIGYDPGDGEAHRAAVIIARHRADGSVEVVASGTRERPFDRAEIVRLAVEALSADPPTSVRAMLFGEPRGDWTATLAEIEAAVARPR